MLHRHKHGSVVWIDLESPSRDEVREIVDEFSIDPSVAEELLLPSIKPCAIFHEHYAYLVLHFPALRHTHRSREQEIDFIIGPSLIITAHYDMIDPLHKFLKIFEARAMLEDADANVHAGHVLVHMLARLYKAVEHEIEYIQHDLSVIEEHIFQGHEVTMVEAISRSSRDLLNLRQTIEPHREVLRSFEDGSGAIFGAQFAPNLRELSGEYYRVHNHVMRHIDFLHELRETNNSLLSTKQNETMRVLTILALLTFPLSLFVAIFDINTADNPFNSVPYGWWIIVGILTVFALLMLAFFKHRRWL